MIRYLAAFAFSARRRSLKSSVIMGRRSFEVGGECIGGLAQFANRYEPLPDGPGLPVAVGLGLLLIEIGDATDCLVQANFPISDLQIPGPRNGTWGTQIEGYCRSVPCSSSLPFTSSGGMMTAAATLSSGSR